MVQYFDGFSNMIKEFKFRVLGTYITEWTGYEDFNKEEIYVGDIVKDIDGDIFKVECGKYKEEMICFLTEVHDKCINKFQKSITEENIQNLELKVIGNIYQNPELLEDKSNV